MSASSPGREDRSTDARARSPSARARGRARAVTLLFALGCAPSSAPRDDSPRERTPRAAASPAAVAAGPSETTPRVTGELMIRRTLCYGTCPAYLAFIDAGGRVFYYGDAYVERVGVHTGQVEPAEVGALLDRTRRSGYFEAEHDYERAVTDNPTVFSSVVVDGRRQWVRNYARAAPPSVAKTETAIDALLERAVWEDPPRLRSADAGGCAQLGARVATRCDQVLTLRGAGGDCSHWFTMWDSLRAGRNADESALEPRCARLLRSLELTDGPPIEPVEALDWGPECTRWLDERVGACRRDLLAGDVEGSRCAEIMSRAALTLELVLGVDGDRDEDRAGLLRAAELQCGRWVRR